MLQNTDPLSRTLAHVSAICFHAHADWDVSSEEDLSSRRLPYELSFNINDFFTAEICNTLYAYTKRRLHTRERHLHKDIVHDWVLRFLTNWYDGKIDKAKFIQDVYLADSTSQKCFVIVSVLNALSRDHHKRKSSNVIVTLLADLGEEEKLPCHRARAEGDLDAKVILEQIRRIKNPLYRQIIELRMEGFGDEELMKELDISEEALINAKHRALKQFRIQLTALGIHYSARVS